jgi:DNA polymerase-3 subunit delta'
MDARSRMTTNFAPWQQRAYGLLVDIARSERLPHGLLLSGPSMLGKHDVAVAFSKWLLCERRDQSEFACGKCASCHFFSVGTHPDLIHVSRDYNDKGNLRTEIVVDQVRKLGEWFTLTPARFGMQIAIIEPADAFNISASNALLKTLEEPLPGRLLVLVSADPSRLPATIRSRCQKLEFRLPPREEALAWLRGESKSKSAEEALDAARGHPGLAAQWLADGSLDLRRSVADDLRALTQGRASATATAQRWNADDSLALRLRFAADIALDAAGRLTDPVRTRRLAAWFAAANRARDLLRTTVRADLLVAGLLLDWPLGGAQNVVKAKA